MSFLQMTVIGRLGRAPEFRTVGEKRVGSFSIATDKKVKGEKVTTWVNVSCWNERLCETIEAYVKKGHQIMVQGTPSVRTYDSRDKGTVASLELDITYGQLVLLANKDEDQGEDRVLDSASQRKPATRKPLAAASDIDDDIPF